MDQNDYSFYGYSKTKIKFIRASQSRADDTDTTNTWTDVSSYFVDTIENKPISKDEIRK